MVFDFKTSPGENQGRYLGKGTKIAKWTRHNGVDEYGRRTIVITENSEIKKPYVPLIAKFQIAMMKVFFGLGLLAFVLLTIARSL